MQAVRTTLKGLPACSRRRAKARIVGLQRRAVRAAMYRAPAHGDASAPDGTLAAQFSTVVVVRRQSGQGRDLAAIEPAQFG